MARQGLPKNGQNIKTYKQISNPGHQEKLLGVCSSSFSNDFVKILILYTKTAFSSAWVLAHLCKPKNVEAFPPPAAHKKMVISQFSSSLRVHFAMSFVKLVIFPHQIRNLDSLGPCRGSPCAMPKNFWTPQLFSYKTL